MASPTKLTARIRPKRAVEAAPRFHQMAGSRDSSSRAWSIIWPQEPSMPMPSQARMASESTSTEKSSTKVITTRCMRLGSTCRQMMRGSDTPRARAACT